MCSQYERSLKNQAANQPYNHALYYSTYALSEVQWSFEEKLAVFDELTQPAVEAFLKEFLGHLFVECLFYGNFTKHVRVLMIVVIRLIAHYCQSLGYWVLALQYQT